MGTPIQLLNSASLRELLLNQGFPDIIVDKLYDNKMNGERFFHLTKEKLNEMFPNNEGLTKRLSVFIKSENRKSCQIEETQKSPTIKDQSFSTTMKPQPKPRKKSSETTTDTEKEKPLKSSKKEKPIRRRKQEPKPVQICYTEGDTERYVLDENVLRNILCREDLKDTPVAVYSLAGSFRKGKSFMLNLFMRHLQLKRSPDWLKDKTAHLRDGFRCRGGSERCTEGIWMWNEPFVVKDKNGKEIAVYLMDTQGTSDLKTGMTGNSVIFALSTLLSSVQIFNVSQQVEAHNLQLLKLFTDYGRMASSQPEDNSEISKPFQSLIFLIRDWSDTDYKDGMEGGRKYLEDVLQVQNDKIEELKVVRENIRESFEDVECFLMPEPGKAICKGGTKTAQTLTIGEIEKEFLDCVDDFVRYLFHERVVIKRVNEEKVTGNDLLNLAISYCNAFSSADFPKVDTIYEASAKAAIQKTMEKAKSVYSEAIFEKMVGQFQDEQDFKNYHKESKKESLLFYDAQKKMGDKKFLATMRERFEEILEGNFKLLWQKNAKDKAKAKALWSKKKQKINEKYYQNMRKMWKPTDEVKAQSHECDKVCRKDALESASQLLEDYPDNFVKQCKEDLERNLDKTLEYITNYFLKAKEAIKNITEDAKMTARNIYDRYMDQHYSFKYVDEKEILESHEVFRSKALNHFSTIESMISEKRLILAKTQCAAVIESLKETYLQNNKIYRETENAKMLEVVKEAVECYISLMEANKEDRYIVEKDLEQKHEESKKQAISETCRNHGISFFEKCQKKAETEINSQFSNIKKLNIVQKNKAIRNFKKQAETLLQNYRENMKKVVKSKVSEDKLSEAHNVERNRAFTQYHESIPVKEPKDEYHIVYKELNNEINKAWDEMQKDKQALDQAEADLAIETAIVSCLNIIKQIMDGRHIREDALNKLYKLAKVNRDIEFKKLGISKKSEKRSAYMNQFEKHYREICEKNKLHKLTCVQVNYDPFEDDNSLCTIL